MGTRVAVHLSLEEGSRAKRARSVRSVRSGGSEEERIG